MQRVQVRLTVVVASLFAVLAVSSVFALVSSMSVSSALHSVLDENVPSMLAASEVQVAMLEQRGCVSAYILDAGNQDWIDQLHERKASFARALAIARANARTSEEVETLQDLARAYDEYDAKRDLVLSEYATGDVDSAIRVLLDEVPDLYEATKSHSDNLLDVNSNYLQTHVQNAYRATSREWLVTGSSFVAGIVLSCVIVGMLTVSVFRPLQAVADEAHQLASANEVDAPSRSDQHLGSLPQSLRSIAGNLTDTRANLEESRRELQQAQKLSAVGQMAAEVLHEIRSLLTTMNLCMHVDGTCEPTEFRDSMDGVHQEMVRLQRNFTEFLEFARAPEPQPELYSASQLVEIALALAGPRLSAKELDRQVEFAPQLPRVFVDLHQIKQVLVNLLTNACDAAPHGSTLTITATAEPHEDGRQMVVIRVRNEGPEIPGSIRGRLFHPYFTTKRGGVGLGLAICKVITQLHHGQLLLESSTASETVFALWLLGQQEESYGYCAAS